MSLTNEYVNVLKEDNFNINKLINFVLKNKKEVKEIHLLEDSLFAVMMELNKYDKCIDIFNLQKIAGFETIVMDNIIEILSMVDMVEFNRFVNIVLSQNNKIFDGRYEELFNELNIKKFTLLIKKLKNGSKKEKYRIEKFYLMHKDEVISKILRNTKRGLTSSEKKDYEFLMSRLIDEIAEYENKTWSDLYFVGEGSYSEVFRLGDKIIKFGTKAVYDMPNNDYLIEPLIRFNLKTICKKSNTVIEVMEIVNNIKKINFDDKIDMDNYFIENNIKYADFKDNNMGYLLKDNIKHWNKPLADYNGIHGEKTRIRKKGELIIYDLDMVYDENDEKIPEHNYYNDFVYEKNKYLTIKK